MHMDPHVEQYQPDPWARAYAKLFRTATYLAAAALAGWVLKQWLDEYRAGTLWKHAEKFAPLIAFLACLMFAMCLWREAVEKWRTRSRLNAALLETMIAAIPICYLVYIHETSVVEAIGTIICFLGVFWVTAELERAWPKPGTRVRPRESTEPQRQFQGRSE